MLAQISAFLDEHARSPHLDETERGHVHRCQALLQQGDAAFCRHQLAPGHFTASAFVLSPCKTELLLIRHRKLNRWLQPGGHFEPTDASLEAAIRREVSEEVGLTDMTSPNKRLFDVDVHAIPTSTKQEAHEHFDLRMLFHARTREIQAGSDAESARWEAFEGIKHLESDLSVLRAVARLR